MDDSTIGAIIEAAKAQPPELQGRWIAEQAIAATRAADAGISDQALEAEYQAWFMREWYRGAPGPLSTAVAVGWARHWLSRRRHAT